MSRPDSCPHCGSRGIRAHTGTYCQECGEPLTPPPSPHHELPAHGPGCRPLAGLKSTRFPNEPRYICAANCPRKRALAQVDSAADTAAASKSTTPRVA
jgi:hypothetical protein